MLGRYDSAEERAQAGVELLAEPTADPVAWAMARRVLGLVVDHRGDPDRGRRALPRGGRRRRRTP